MGYRDAQGERSGYRRHSDVMTNWEMVEKIAFLIILVLVMYALASMFVIAIAMGQDGGFVPAWAKPVATLLSYIM